MLTHIHIRDFVIVDELEIEFAPGMTALTGETGAGKSILIDALGLIIGDRASTDVIRHKCDRAEIVAMFDVTPLSGVRAWLEDHELEDGNECQIRRVINREGRSRAYVNGSSVPGQYLKKLGAMLIDIHGQHEHQSLMHRDTQRQLLDSYAGITGDVEELRDRWRQWRAKQDELEALQAARKERSDRIDLLTFQLKELQELALAEGELETIESEHARLANAGQLLDVCQRATDTLYENESSVSNVLSRAVSELEDLARIDDSLSPVSSLLNNALIQIQEAMDDLRRYSSQLELDPARLNWLDERLAAVQGLARKHNVAAEELPRILARTEKELGTLDDADASIESLQTAVTAIEKNCLRKAGAISKSRMKLADALGSEISATMGTLGMKGGHFSPRVEALGAERLSQTGYDQIEFMVSANPGQPLMPLARVASGGELSRISLAIQVASKDTVRVPTLIFDEVDTGIGGRVAEIVGKRLRELGNSDQVFCVTHLPQVAAQAHAHLHVSKLTGKSSTRTRVGLLKDEQRVEEIARMLGGIEVTESTLAHAKEMIERGQEAGKVAPPKQTRIKKA